MAEEFPISDEKWLERTRVWVKRFDLAIAELERRLIRDVDPILARAEINGLKSMRSDLELQLAEFEARVRGK